MSPANPGGSRSKLRRSPSTPWWLLWLAGACVLTVFAVMTATFVYPRQDAPRQVDAIVVLGGLNGKPVIREALRLARSGVSGQVVISDSFGKDTLAARLCEDTTDITVECFSPDPGTTLGEAQTIARITADRGWDSVLVITATYHVSRARLILERCLASDVSVTGVMPPMDASAWIYQYAYQSAAYVKAWSTRKC